MNLIISPAKAGSTNRWETVPRAALRFTSFRHACPGLNSAAGDAGWLSGSLLKALMFGTLWLTLLFLASCSKTSSSEQPPTKASPPSANVRSSADVVKVRASAVSPPAGGNADAAVALLISAGYHVNANPATFSYLIATEVQRLPVIDGYCATLEKPIYPTAITRTFSFAEKPLAVYEGEVAIRLPLRLTQPGENGCRTRANTGVSFSIPISVRVQACDQEKCFPPDTLPASIPVEVK